MRISGYVGNGNDDKLDQISENTMGRTHYEPKRKPSIKSSLWMRKGKKMAWLSRWRSGEAGYW